jgi:hypothetical protein
MMSKTTELIIDAADDSHVIEDHIRDNFYDTNLEKISDENIFSFFPL